jgi:tetratricopeptide (TPR) repeat protein
VRRAARDPAAFDAEGLAHLALRDPSQALGEFTQAIDLLPAAHPVGKPPVDKAIANDTSNDTQARQIQYRLDRAHAFMARGDAESALHDITLVIELDPADVAAVAEAGAIEFNRGRPDAAESWFKAWCGLQPNRIEPWYNLGTTLLAKRDPSAAIAAFDNALQIDGADAATLNNRGVALLKLGKETAARADFTRAIQAQPGYLLAVENRAAAELRSGNAVQATADYLTLVEHRPLEPKLLVDLGLAYQKRGDLDAAINNFDAAIHQDANLAVAYLDRALAYAAKSPVLLKPIDNRAVTGNTSSLVPANNPAAPLSEQAINAWYQVVRDADSAIRLDATSAVAYQTRAYAYDQLGQTARAAADLEQARKLAH